MGRALLLALALAGCADRADPTWSPHARAVAERPEASGPDIKGPPWVPLRDAGDRPQMTVYGYWPYWGDDLDTLPWDQLTHVAIFDVGLQADGSLANVSRWTNNAPEAMALAAPHGVKVHLTVTSFSDTVMNTVLPSPSLRATAIDNLVALVEAQGAHGVNVDFEGMDRARKADLVDFVVELKARVPEVYLATPAIDWQGAYDYDLLALGSDGLFIMGYGYHWSGGNPGPNAPLHSSATWGSHSLEWSVNDYRTWGTPDPRIVLGLPLYGRNWPTTNNDIPGTRTGDGVTVVYSNAIVDGPAMGAQRDPASDTMYAFPDATHQLWYDDAKTLETKIAWARDEGIQGVGFWALTYEDADPDLWSRIDAVTHAGLALAAPAPGAAGTSNTFVVRNVDPGTQVALVVGTRDGATSVPGCAGTRVDLAGAIYLGSAAGNANGVATFTVDIPAAAAGRTGIFQVADRGRCEVSNPVRVTL